MFKYSTVTQSIGKIYSDSLQLYKQSLGKILLWTLPYAFIMRLLSYTNNMSTPTNPAALTNTLSTYLPHLYLFIPGIIIPILLVPSLWIILIAYMHVTGAQTENWPSPIYLLKQFYWRVLGANLLCTLVMIIGVALLFAITLLPVYLIHDETLKYGFMFLIGIIDIIVLLFALIILYPYLAFYNVFIVLENFAVVQSIKASFKLATGNWWRTTTVLGIAQLFTMLIIGIIIYIVFDHTLTMLIVGAIVEGLLTPIPMAFTLILFNDLKIRKAY